MLENVQGSEPMMPIDEKTSQPRTTSEGPTDENKVSITSLDAVHFLPEYLQPSPIEGLNNMMNSLFPNFDSFFQSAPGVDFSCVVMDCTF